MATLTFPYTIDETISSLQTDPSKLGKINDFRPYYYFDAGSIAWLHGTRIGTKLQMRSIQGKIFEDLDGNSIWNTGDTPLHTKTVKIYQKQNDGSYSHLADTLSNSSGEFLFDSLNAGEYKIDFNTIKDNNDLRSAKSSNTDRSIAITTESSGLDAGWTLNLNLTNRILHYANAGILKYTPTLLKIDLAQPSYDLLITSNTSHPTRKLLPIISPKYFDQIKATTDPITRSSQDSTIVSVTQDGTIRAETVGSTTITVTIKDKDGHTASKTVTVNVKDTIPVQCDITYSSSRITNQPVTATLTNCNKPITVTNNA